MQGSEFKPQPPTKKNIIIMLKLVFERREEERLAG